MKSLLLSSSVLFLSACTINLHIHESPKPLAAPETTAQAAPAAKDGLSGVVVDAQGQPVKAHVAAIGSTGSVGMSTDDQGRFELAQIQWPEIVINASSKDGRVAVRSARTGESAVELVLQPGATLVIDVEGRERTRCAIFQGEMRIEDFTLRTGKPAHVVVPPGDVRVRLYDGDRIYQEQLLSAARGATQPVSFKLDS